MRGAGLSCDWKLSSPPTGEQHDLDWIHQLLLCTWRGYFRPPHPFIPFHGSEVPLSFPSGLKGISFLTLILHLTCLYRGSL